MKASTGAANTAPIHRHVDHQTPLYQKRPAQQNVGFFRFLFESEALLAKKLADHRQFSIAMFVMSAFVGILMWLWDYAIDPFGAMHTISLRLFFLILLTYPIAFRYIKNRRLLEFTCVATGLLLVANLLEIMNHLQTGMIYGIGLYVFFMFFPLLMFQGFSLRVNVFTALLLAVFPHIFANAGLIQGFQHAEFAVLVWPAAIAMMLAHYAFAHNYRLRFESDQALQFASDTDPMTGVSNRRHFMPKLQQEISRGQRFMRPVSLMILDIDHFKKINDTYGHPTGDLVICALADICQHTARQNDIVARLGGEEFAVLLLEVQFHHALLVAERIRMVVANSVITSANSAPVTFTVSIGVAEQSLYNVSEDKLIELADAALYEAKSAGRNRVMGATLAGISPIWTLMAEFRRQSS
jgi:diguanylate cyclase (GGDEF)-like protein